MSRFDKFFQMTVDDIVEYTLEKTSGQIDWDKGSMHALVPPEHGNLNYVYRVWDDAGHSIYIKQACLELRISKDLTATTDRNRLEAEILKFEDELCPGSVPKIYFYDTVMCASGMEDCSDYEVMRNAMLKHETSPALPTTSPPSWPTRCCSRAMS